MAKDRGKTGDRILAEAWEVVRANGPDALTFDAVATRVGVSKQAVLYHFPNKARLIEALVRPALVAEGAVGRSAVADAKDMTEAVRAFLGALSVFHVADLDRFRLMYVAPQIGQRPGRKGEMLSTLGRVHPATTEMYDALADRLMEGRRYKRLLDARRAAAAIHTALLGLILRMAMADALNQPLRHRADGLIDALVEVIAPRPEAA